jgi:hypothetical protein
MSRKNKRQVPRQTVLGPVGTRVEFNPDYSTTKHELRRIGILAGTFFAILIALSFFQDKLLKLFLK